MKLKTLFMDKYFVVDINDLKIAVKEEKIQIKNIDTTKFDELPKEYQKLIIVIPAFPKGGKGWLYEFVSNYCFDVRKLEQNNSKKIIECIGYEKISFYLKTLFDSISEIEVYNFFNSLNNNELMIKYIEAINSVFYKNQINEDMLINNSNLTKIRRKYE